jgi:nucleotide-binding universal stress UspA family protein
MEVLTMVEINKILFPCDLTENSDVIIPYVLSLAEKYNSGIYLLHVVRDLSKWGGLYAIRWRHPSVEVIQQEANDAAERQINRVCVDLMKSCPNFQKKIVSGDPAAEILKIIESEGIGLVIMATHGRKGLEHTIMGSVAENVVKSSPVPVLIINPFNIK